MRMMTVGWPAWVRFKGEAELLSVTNQTEWELDPDLHAWPYDADDRLVDSAGREFVIDFVGEPGKGIAVPVPTGAVLDATTIREAVRAHFRLAAGRDGEHLRALEALADDEVASAA